MPSLNSVKFIDAAIASVLAQTHAALELIVVDNPSTDGTSEIIAQYAAQDARVKHVRLERNLGSAAKSRNQGLALAKGNYIAFLDSDDLWSQEKLTQQVTEMKRTGSPFAYTGYAVLDEGGSLILPHEHVPNVLTYRAMLQRNAIATSTVLFDRSIIKGFQFPEDVPVSEDYSAWLSVFKCFDFACGLDKPLTQYRVVKNSLSSKKYKTALVVWGFLRRQEGLGPIHASWNFANYAIYAWLKNRRFGRI
jgi:teichuronic acid biosynthesis glycosyltransferase TuaG